MLRYKLTFLFSMATLFAFAQRADTSLFFRYAATFDNLVLTQYFPAQTYMPDTASLLLFNAAPVNVSMKKSVTRTMVSSQAVSTENLGTTGYTWDREGRVTGYREYHANDTVVHLNVRFRFLARQSMGEVIAMNGNNVDTTVYQYNRSGWVGTWKRHVVNADTAFLITGTRMYDSRGKLIVATNADYGPLNGTYTFEYNNDGRLIRRAFLSGGSGIVLCTDTIEYEFVTSAKLILKMTHKLKVAGIQKWVTLESRTVYPTTGKIISYTDRNDADSNFFYRNLPVYNLQYEYDDKGRVVLENFGNDLVPNMITAKYYYGKQHAPDSVVYTERVEEKKSSYTRVYSRDVRQYDDKGRIATRTVTTYLFEAKKKKDKMVPEERVSIVYSWQPAGK